MISFAITITLRIRKLRSNLAKHPSHLSRTLFGILLTCPKPTVSSYAE